MIPYTPEELIDIANKQYAWCETEMKKAAKEMGYDDWHQALEKVKQDYVQPGDQPQMIRDLAEEAAGPEDGDGGGGAFRGAPHLGPARGDDVEFLAAFALADDRCTGGEAFLGHFLGDVVFGGLIIWAVCLLLREAWLRLALLQRRAIRR
jgi:hypothetical protein